MKKAMKNAVLVLLFLALSVSAGGLAYLHFIAPEDKNLTGEWTAQLDVTEQATVKALSWLQDIEAVSISLEDMESYMQDLKIQVNLTFEQTKRWEGTFRCCVLPENYEACRQAAYEAFAQAFRDLLLERLRMAGYTGGTEQDAIEALVVDTFGMSTVSYLMTCCPDLLPSLEDLQAQYDSSGVYEISEDILIRQLDPDGAAATQEERYIRQDYTLILFEEKDNDVPGLFSEHYPMIYTLEQIQ